MEKIKKFIDVDIEKALEPNSYVFTASTESRDRQGDVIVQSGWKLSQFKKNPVILWAHDYSQPPVGKATEVTNENGKLKIKVQFASKHSPFAAMIENMVAEKYINAVSVGFMAYKSEPLTDEDKKQRVDNPYGRRLSGELLEVSMVPVPANPEALGRQFGELVTCGLKMEQALKELESPLLPCKTESGAVDPRLLNASFGALFGARRGVPVPDSERKACFNFLARMATEAGLTPWEFREYSQPELKERCADVWHDELLTIVEKGMNVEDKQVAFLLKGERRARFQAMVDDFTKLLEATEDDAIEAPRAPAMPEGFPELLKGLTETMAEINGRIKAA